jgi:5'-nucleotidase
MFLKHDEIGGIFMFNRRISFSFSIFITVALLAASFMTAVAAPKTTASVQILALNDFHGALDGGNTRGGVEYMTTIVAQKRAENPSTVFISAGDLIGASPLLSALFHDEPTILAFNLMGLDYNVTGNHEFDEGVAELQRMQEGGCHPVDGCLAGEFPGASFKFLAANVIRLQNGKTLFSEYKVKSFADAKIGFIGIAYQDTPTIVSAAGTEGVEFLNEVDVINAMAAQLKDQGIKTIVVIIHDGGSVSTGTTTPNTCTNISGSIVDVVNNSDPEIDLFITGHTHGVYNCVINDRMVTSAYTGGEYLTDIDLVLERKTGNILSKTVTNIPVSHDVAKDPAMTSLLSTYRTLAAPLANQVIGSITSDIVRLNDRSLESALGDVIADAQLAETAPAEKGGAVIAFINPGGIRNNLLYSQISGSELPGEVTYGEAFAVQPFGNDLVTMTMTGAQIKAVLEQQATTNLKLQISNGLTYTFTKSAPADNHVTNLLLNGSPIDPLASYRVTLNSFLSTGGDGFTIFNQGTDRLVGTVDINALVDYLSANSPVSPGPMNRITIIP